MKSGTPGFRGEKLLEARQARGVTGVALANVLGVDRSTITHYDKNEQTPSPDVMERISSSLNLPISFFLEMPKPSDVGVFHYRSLAAATKAVRTQAQRRHDWLRRIVMWLSSMVEFPEIAFLDVKPPTDPGLIDNEFIERAAQATRRYWSMGDGPIRNVPRLLENQGAILSLSSFGSEDLEAFSESGLCEFNPYVSLSASKKVPARANLTAAHELGHLILHRNIPENIAMRGAEHKLIEKQAYRFADAFLLPAQTFAPQVNRASLDVFRAMKPSWHVSIGAMIMRSRDLRLIGEEQYRRLWMAYSKRGWKHGEPYDDATPFEGPRVLRQTIEMLLSERVTSKNEIVSALPFATTDIEKLCGLDEGYLREGFGVSKIRFGNRGGERVPRGVIGDVVMFDKERRNRP